MRAGEELTLLCGHYKDIDQRVATISLPRNSLGISFSEEGKQPRWR